LISSHCDLSGGIGGISPCGSECSLRFGLWGRFMASGGGLCLEEYEGCEVPDIRHTTNYSIRVRDNSMSEDVGPGHTRALRVQNNLTKLASSIIRESKSSQDGAFALNDTARKKNDVWLTTGHGKHAQEQLSIDKGGGTIHPEYHSV